MSIENQLSELIRYANHVTVPGIGKFQLVYKPATIDYVQKRITPPGKFISFQFDEQSTYQDITTDQCPEIDRLEWESTGQEWQARLNNKETILIPNIGSIYKDFRGEIHFLASGLNYDDAGYGLQNIKIDPVIRKPLEQTPAPTILQKSNKNSKRWSSQFADTAFSVLIGLTLIVISFGIWYAMSSKQINQPSSRFQVAESTLEDQKKLEDILDYDAKWSVPGYMGEDTLYADSIAESFGDVAEQDEETITEEKVKTETNTVIVKPKVENIDKKITETKKSVKKPEISDSESKCMISVGSFSDKANALSLFKKLLKKGFKSEIKTTSTAMSRVVVLSNCSENELNAMLNKLKSEFNQQAFIVN